MTFRAEFLLAFCSFPIIPMGPGRSSSLRNGGDSSAISSSWRTGGASDSLNGVVL